MHEPTQTQAEIWAADNLGVEISSYQVSLLLDIAGELSVTALRSALRDVVERHEILRTRLTLVAGELQCDVVPSDRFGLDVVTDLPAAAARLGIRPDLVVLQMDRELDLSEGLPIMARLTSTGPNRHSLCVKVHHVAFDDWSRNVFCKELEDRYGAYLRGEATAVTPRPAQYAAYCQSRDAEARELERDSLKFWRSTLQGFEPFEIPPLRPRPPRRRGRGQSSSFDVSSATVEALTDLARSEHCTVAMALLAAVQVALARFCGTAAVNFGTVIADRADDEAQEIIGPLLNTVVLACDASGDPTLATMIRRMRDTLLDAITHRHVPFSTLARDFGSQGDLSRNPLCRVMVQYVGEPRRTPQFARCRSSEVVVPTTSSKYDLSIFLSRTGDGGLSVSLGWDSDLFDAQLMAELGQVIRAVIEHMARDASARSSTVPIMTKQARSALLWMQAGERVDHGGTSIRGMVAAQAGARPAAPALVAADGSVCTYEELERQAHRVAMHLRTLRLDPEAIVAIFARRSVEQVVAVLGAIEAGVPYLAIEPGSPLERSEFMLRDARAEAVIVASDGLPPELASCVASTLVLAEILDEPLEERAVPAAVPQQLAALIYTSGSTGRPKGVMLTAGDLADRIHDLQRQIRLTPADRVLWKASSGFDLAIMEMLWPLCFGGVVVIARPGGQSDPAYLVDLMRSRSVTVAFLVPPVAAAIVEEPALASCPELRVLGVGGDKVDAAIIHAIDARLPNCAAYNLYGPTEATMNASWLRCSSEDVQGMDVVPLGGVLSNTRMHVLDDRLEPVPSGAVGELCIGGSGVARGYHGRPGLTAERFVPDPFLAGARLYRTGDAVRFSMSTGRYQFLGRLDLQVKVGGVRIELGEVESVMRRHKAVVDCAAVVTETGTVGLDRLVAFVTLSSPASTNDLLSFARGFLPSSACPSSVFVVDAMPLTTNGKVDRRSLVARAGAVQVEASAELAGDVPDVLQQLWCEVLGRPAADDRSDFFESGGSSLLAMHLIGRVRDAVQKDVPYSLVFMHPVLGDFREQVLAFETDPEELDTALYRAEEAGDTVVGR